MRTLFDEEVMAGDIIKRVKERNASGLSHKGVVTKVDHRGKTQYIYYIAEDGFEYHSTDWSITRYRGFNKKQKTIFTDTVFDKHIYDGALVYSPKHLNSKNKNIAGVVAWVHLNELVIVRCRDGIQQLKPSEIIKRPSVSPKHKLHRQHIAV